MKAYVLPHFEDEFERWAVDGCLRHFQRGEVVLAMLDLPNLISSNAIDRVCRANLMPVCPF